MGGRGHGDGGRGREIIYLSLHWHHQNYSCILVVQRWEPFQCFINCEPQDRVHKLQPFCRERRAKAESNPGPSAYQPNALPRDQTSSHCGSCLLLVFVCFRSHAAQGVWSKGDNSLWLGYGSVYKQNQYMRMWSFVIVLFSPACGLVDTSVLLLL